MIDLNLKSIQQALQARGLKTDMETTTHQLHANIKINNIDYPLFMRIYEQNHLLQLLLFLPFNIKDSVVNETARLLHLINKQIDLPGFGMDEASHTIFFRQILVGIEGKIDEHLIAIYIESFERIVRLFAVPIVNVSQGNFSYEAVAKNIAAGKV